MVGETLTNEMTKIFRVLKYLLFASYTGFTVAYATERNLIEYTKEITVQTRALVEAIPASLSFRSSNVVTEYSNDGTERKRDALEGFAREGSLIYAQAGEKYRIEDRTATGLHAINRQSVITFDGDSYQRWRIGDDELYLDSDVSFSYRPREYFLRWANPMLLTWEFVSSSLKQDDMSNLEIWEIQNSAKFGAWVEGLKVSGSVQEKFGKQCLIAEIAGGKEAITHEELFYRVFFSLEDNYFPVAWERISKSGRRIFSFHVLKTGVARNVNGEDVVYPLESQEMFFGGTAAIPSRDAPVWSMMYKISDFDLNPTFEESHFEIDPSVAGRIFDVQNKVFIDIPK